MTGISSQGEQNTPALAQALRDAGFDPPPFIGQRWNDPQVTWLTAGHRSIVTITGLWLVEVGWSCTVYRRQIGPDGRVIPQRPWACLPDEHWWDRIPRTAVRDHTEAVDQLDPAIRERFSVCQLCSAERREVFDRETLDMISVSIKHREDPQLQVVDTRGRGVILLDHLVRHFEPIPSWRDIAPGDAVDLNLAERLDIDAPYNEAGERCRWPWDPQQLVNAPLGQYHCDFCGAMVMAGDPHLDYLETVPTNA